MGGCVLLGAFGLGADVCGRDLAHCRSMALVKSAAGGVAPPL